ncbi:MAG: acyl-CoA reductase [Planctomycetota bacterium]|nr:acyl-CoA reductase [Planctomycetota bacterium]
MHLQPLSAREIGRRIGLMASKWLDPDWEHRKQAIHEICSASGFPPNMVAEGIDNAFWQLVPPKLAQLADEELGDSRLLDGPRPHPITGRLSRAVGPGLVTHFLAGSIITPGLWSICRALLLKSASIVKCASHDRVFPLRFAESLRQESSELGECIHVDYWSRRDAEATEAAILAADAVIAFGDDSTIEALRTITAWPRRFVAHGHRVSLAVVDESAFDESTARGIAEDVAFYDQQGCLSPHVVYLIGSNDACIQFGETTAEALSAMEREVPRRVLEAGAAAAIQRMRGTHELQAAMNIGAHIWKSDHSTAWTLLYDENPPFEFSCLNRTLRLKRLDSPAQLKLALSEVSSRLQGAAIAPPALKSEVSDILARHGVSRICSPGKLQNPPLNWKADGNYHLLPLVNWLEVEE